MIKVVVWKVMKDQGKSPSDLMYGARLAQGTAYKFANEDGSEEMQQLDVEVAERIMNYLNVGIADILEVVEDE